MQAAYLKELERRRATKSAKMVEVYKKYGRACKELTAALTKESKIDAAKLAQAEVDRAADQLDLIAMSSATGSSLLGVMKRQWTPALWSGREWLNRDWSHMKLEV